MSDEREPVEDEVAEGLRSLGLTEYELRVYLGILRHPGSRIPEVARKSGVPQPKVYATVKRLLERGLCQSELGPVNTYTALPPKLGLAPLLEELRGRATQANDVVSHLEHEFEEPADSIAAREGRVKLFQGKQPNMRNFQDLVASAEESVDLMTRLPLLIRDDDDAMERAIARGVGIRILTEAPSDYDWKQDPIYQRQVELGVRGRSLPQVPMRMGIFDSKVSILSMQGPETGSRGMLTLEVRNQGLSRSMLDVFETYWGMSEALPLERE